MFSSFLEGFLLGIGAAIPLGPINLLIMNHALRDYKRALLIGLGAMSADTLYLALILLGLSTFFTNPLITKLLGVLGSIFLLYLAYQIFKERHRTLHTDTQKEKNSARLTFYIQGFALTFINPYTFAFWLSIGGYTAQRDHEPLITIIGMICAIFLWITLMPYFVSRSKHMISQKVAYYFNLFSSILLMGFGISLALHLFI